MIIYALVDSLSLSLSYFFFWKFDLNHLFDTNSGVPEPEEPEATEELEASDITEAAAREKQLAGRRIRRANTRVIGPDWL